MLVDPYRDICAAAAPMTVLQLLREIKG